MYKTTLRKFY
uniref:Uncharacterized protein n=1 Tax=Moniliophthora roreri TaxID=221103 RepID=A0A0W0FVY8_MONRR